MVSAGDAAFTLFFNVPQEGAQQVRIDVWNKQFVYFLMYLRGSEHHQQANGIAIALLCVTGKISLRDEVLHQEASDPRAEGRAIVHGALRTRIPGNGDWPPPATPVSWS